jgi:DNA-binding NarL/FixJ family response regulator
LKAGNVVLLIEDDIDELYAFEKALSRAGIVNPVKIARHLQESLCYLRGVGVYGNRSEYPLPVLVILNMALAPEPVAAERILECLRSSQELARIPVIALARSEEHDEVQSAYDRGVSGYFLKGRDLTEVVELIGEMQIAASSPEGHSRQSLSHQF